MFVHRNLMLAGPLAAQKGTQIPHPSGNTSKLFMVQTSMLARNIKGLAIQMTGNEGFSLKTL